MSASPSPDASAHTAPHTTQIDTMTSAPTTTPLRLADVEDVAASSHSMPPASPKVSNAARNQFPRPSIGVASEGGASRFCFTAIILREFGFFGTTDEPSAWAYGDRRKPQYNRTQPMLPRLVWRSQIGQAIVLSRRSGCT